MEKNYNGWNDSKTRASGIPESDGGNHPTPQFESNSEDMSFREMITGLFDTSFMTASELDTIVKVGEMYAAAKIRNLKAEGMAGEETQENKAIQVLDWLADANNNGINNDPFLKIILCDGEYYWDTDNDGDQPISATDLYKLFIKNKYTQP